MSRNHGLLWAGGLVGLAALAVASNPTGRQAVESAVDEGTDWLRRVLGRTSQNEGRYDSLNLNTDGAGLSFGIIQWNQRSGSLGRLLQAMWKADSARFTAIFGPASPQLLSVTLRGSLEPVEGAVLWKQPWIDRFRAAGREPVFQVVQYRIASSGEYMQAAIATARSLGVVTERGISIAYDTAVQQGASAARQAAQQTRVALAGKTLPARDVLSTFIAYATARFRRLDPPSSPHAVPGLVWRQVGASEWHAFRQQVDIYTDCNRRRQGILNDVGLSDKPVAV